MLSDYTDAHATSSADEDEELEGWASSAPSASSRPSSALSGVYAGDHNDDDDDDDDVHPFHSGLTAPTTFDSYFLHASKPSRTSASVFSDLVAPLSPEEYTAALARAEARAQRVPSLSLSRTRLWEDPAAQRPLFARYAQELDEGFNLLFYGYGSKRCVLNAFARALAAQGKGRHHVVVANAFQPGFALKELLSSVEQIPALQDAEELGQSAGQGATSTSVDAQTQRVFDYFSRSVEGEEANASRLFLVIHNIDGPGLRTTKANACLAQLALAPRIHIVASIDHIAAPSRWTLSELFARKAESPYSPQHRRTKVRGTAKGKARASDGQPDGTQAWADMLPRRGFAWLWHDLTTLAPYDFELARADPGAVSLSSSLKRTAGAGVGHAGGAGTAIISESAARHVLASVTQKARRLFVLLGSRQLELMAESSGAGGAAQAQTEAYDYERLFNAARDEFVATSDTALRALLGEFRDHGVVVSVVISSAGAGEALWIPMRKDALTKIVGELKAEGL
ncbi:uncharacterized protein FIBRA_08019 [Fibroporia radiculosa]|uniref:Origin recognition complex subunit 2 n=1 Tax=Fibroporia radiculosa TaxID=599839 RepID=J4IC48_9APHY|nr:uncharacterized protein FIBRA_08019 [Fibroporia radiculosa]CCM05786.1 predicted protein [Fibroporia radiculosa]